MTPSTIELINSMYRGDLRLPTGVTVSPPWDIGSPQPAVVELVETGQVSGRVLDAGCGTGEHVAYLVEHGHETVGVDASEPAIALARDKIRARGLAAELVATDAVELDGYADAFDTVLDIGLFHILTPRQRQQYARSLHRACRADAVLHVLCYSGYAGPDELRAAFAEGWDVTTPIASRFVSRVADQRLANEWYRATADPAGMLELPAWQMSARHQPKRLTREKKSPAVTAT